MNIIRHFIPTIIDSIETSVSMGFYESIEKSTYAHIYQSKLVKFPMNKCKNSLDNFDPKRLQSSAEEAYPTENRPRGYSDIHSVNYYITKIKNGNEIPPIWIIKKDHKCTLLDGAHRIVACNIELKDKILAYIIED